MVLFNDVVGVLHRSISAAVANHAHPLQVGDRVASVRAKTALLIGGLRVGVVAMRSFELRLAPSMSGEADTKNS